MIQARQGFSQVILSGIAQLRMVSQCWTRVKFFLAVMLEKGAFSMHSYPGCFGVASYDQGTQCFMSNMYSLIL